MALVTNNISGSSSNSSKIGITGSVIIGNAPNSRFPTSGTDTVLFVSGSDTARSVFGGTAVVSGSLITDGNVQLGDSSNDTLTINASTVAIPNNLNFDSNTLYIDSVNNRIGIGKVPNVTFDVSGTLNTVGADKPSTIFNGDTFISGAFGVSDYIQMNPVGSLRIPTNKSASYIYTSGSTNDLYFTQYAPGTDFTNTTRLRWLESMLSTGLLHGGILSTQAGTTTFSITSGSAIIVAPHASTTADPYPTVNLVTWPTTISQSLSYVTSSQITYIGINPSGGLIQRVTPFSDGDYLDYISIGRILHQSGSVTNAAVTNPVTAYGLGQQHGHFVRAFGPLKISGHTLTYSGSTLGLTKTAGDSYAEGRNYRTDPDDPNYVSSTSDTAVTTSKIYREYVSGSTYHIDIGVGGAGYTVIDPTLYNNNGTLATVAAGQYSNQRVYWFPNSVDRALYVYYGNTTYNSLDTAEAGIVSEAFTEGDNTRTSAIFVGVVVVKSNATDLSNTSQARFVQGGLFRSIVGAGGGGGSGGTTTPGGLDTYVQFNDGGSTFGGDAGFTFDKTNHILSIGDGITSAKITTIGSTFDLVNTNATTVNFAGGASTALNIGNSAGTNTISGTSKFSQGLSGSLTKLTDGTSYLIADGNMSVVTGSNGAITLSTVNSGTIHGVTAGTGLTGGGTSGTVTLSINNSVVATISGSTFTGVTKHNAGLSGSLTKLTDGTSYLIAGSGLLISTGSTGAITLSRSGSIDGDITAVVAGTGLTGGGLSGSVSLAIDNSVVATVSGTTFTGATKHNSGLSGSLTKLVDGTSYLIAGNGTTIATGSNGAITITSTGSPAGSTSQIQYNNSGVFAGSSTLTFNTAGNILASINISSTALTASSIVAAASSVNLFNTTATSINLGGSATSINIGNSSGTNVVSGTIKAPQGFSGSLTKLTDGTSYLVAGSGLLITTGSTGAITLARSGTIDGDITGVTAGTGLTGGGLSGSVSLAIDNSIVATVSGTTFTGATKHNAGLSGSLTKLVDGTSYINAGVGITVTSASNGSLTITATAANVDDFFDSTISGAVFTTGSFAFRGQESISTPASKGTDVFFYVSGSTSVTGSNPNAKISLFGGDITTSGSLNISNGATVVGNLTAINNVGVLGSLSVMSNGLIAGNATVSGSTTTNTLFVNTGNVVGAPGSGANVLSLLSSGNIVMKLDVNNDALGHKFDVQDYLGTSQFFVGENGNAELSGTLVVSGSSLSTTSTTFNLINTSATTVNFAGASTKIAIGGATSTGSIGGNLEVTGSTSLGLVVENILPSNGGTGTVSFNLNNQSIFYVNSPTGNITANFTNVPTTNNRIISTTVVMSQSVTPRIVSGVQIDGAASTINWANNVIPTGNANKQDVFGFSLIRSGSAWKTLGQMTTYG